MPGTEEAERWQFQTSPDYSPQQDLISKQYEIQT